MASAEDWNGFYLGSHIGGGWGQFDWRFRPLAGGSSDTEADHNGVGLQGGVQAGYNRQKGNWVVGAEIDMSLGAIRGSDRCPGASWSCESDAQWFGAAKGKIGYSVSSVLLYATAGAGVAHMEAASDNGTDRQETEKGHLGWVAGLGAEYALGSAWSIRSEYLHYDFSDRAYRNGGIVVDTGFRLDTITIGINRRF